MCPMRSIILMSYQPQYILLGKSETIDTSLEAACALP